jgi:hypothetical protein
MGGKPPTTNMFLEANIVLNETEKIDIKKLQNTF